MPLKKSLDSSAPDSEVPPIVASRYDSTSESDGAAIEQAADLAGVTEELGVRVDDGDLPIAAVPPPNLLESACPVDYEALLRAREADHARELAECEERISIWERRYKDAIRERELVAVLSGKPLVTGAASQLVKLWSDEFEVYDADGATKVGTRDGRSVAKAVADWLASPDYAHFCKSAARGGTNPPGANRANTMNPSASRPRTLGEATIQQWREAAKVFGVESSSPIGLHRRR